MDADVVGVCDLERGLNGELKRVGVIFSRCRKRGEAELGKS